jgi:hypothetical protein
MIDTASDAPFVTPSAQLASDIPRFVCYAAAAQSML